MTQDSPSRALEKIVVRLPDGMRDRLAEAARQNKRSVNAEVVARLEESFGTGPQKETGTEELVARLQAMEPLISTIWEVVKDNTDAGQSFTIHLTPKPKKAPKK